MNKSFSKCLYPISYYCKQQITGDNAKIFIKTVG